MHKPMHVMTDWRSLTPQKSGRLPLTVRTVEDVQILRANAQATRRLRPEGIRVALEGVDNSVGSKFEASLRAYIRSCGCALGGVVALLGLTASLIWLVFQLTHRPPQWGDLLAIPASFLISVLFGGLGKYVGILVARLRFERSCDRLLQILTTHDSRLEATT